MRLCCQIQAHENTKTQFFSAPELLKLFCILALTRENAPVPARDCPMWHSHQLSTIFPLQTELMKIPGKKVLDIIMTHRALSEPNLEKLSSYSYDRPEFAENALEYPDLFCFLREVTKAQCSMCRSCVRRAQRALCASVFLPCPSETNFQII